MGVERGESGWCGRKGWGGYGSDGVLQDFTSLPTAPSPPFSPHNCPRRPTAGREAYRGDKGFKSPFFSKVSHSVPASTGYSTHLFSAGGDCFKALILPHFCLTSKWSYSGSSFRSRSGVSVSLRHLIPSSRRFQDAMSGEENRIGAQNILNIHLLYTTVS